MLRGGGLCLCESDVLSFGDFGELGGVVLVVWCQKGGEVVGGLVLIDIKGLQPLLQGLQLIELLPQMLPRKFLRVICENLQSLDLALQLFPSVQ